MLGEERAQVAQSFFRQVDGLVHFAHANERYGVVPLDLGPTQGVIGSMGGPAGAFDGHDRIS
jgi:hypothetical protein